jgi:hypothetical protein
LPPNPVALDHTATNRIRPPQHLAGGVNLSRPNRFPDARAADGLAVQRHRREAMHLKIQLPAQRFEERHVTVAPVAKNKIRAHADAVDLSQIARQFADEHIAGLLAECLVKVNFQKRVHAQRFDGAQLLGWRVNLRGNPFRSDDGIGMPVERHHQGQRLVLARVGDRLPDDLLVAQMHAVKHANSQADLAGAWIQLVGGMDDFHAISWQGA